MRTNKEVLSEIALTEDMHDNPSYWAENYLAMEAKLAAAEADAGRYRWLIVEASYGITESQQAVLFLPRTLVAPNHIGELDAAIDAARGDK